MSRQCVARAGRESGGQAVGVQVDLLHLGDVEVALAVLAVAEAAPDVGQQHVHDGALIGAPASLHALVVGLGGVFCNKGRECGFK